MEKLLLIIKREYLTRVKKKSFIIYTLIGPLAIALFFVVVGVIFSYKGDESMRILVSDEGNVLSGSLRDEHNLFYTISPQPLDSLKKTCLAPESDYDGVLLIPKIEDLSNQNLKVFFYSDEKLALDTRSIIEGEIRDKVRDFKIESLQLDRKQLESLDTKVEIDPEPLTSTTQDESAMTGVIAAAIGGVMGFIMYTVVVIYGMMIMKSVMEEKTSRIVEVIISSVSPFQLMLGKIIGVGLVGLTQMLIWLILVPIISFGSSALFGFDPGQGMPAGNLPPEEMQATAFQIFQELSAVNWVLIVPMFLLFFLGGYFLYSSLYAAIGSAAGDDLGESQSLTLPITIPIILALYIMMAVIGTPNSTLAVWASMIPFTSPIVMPARLAFDIPAWQIITSLVILFASTVFFVFLSARIYRVGILLYGKKASLRELGKWLFYKSK